MRRALYGLLAAVVFLTTAVAVFSNYPESIESVLISEGGSRYTNHPRDPGGPTKYGITLNDVRRYINRSATAQTVRDLTEEQAHEIYKTRYWDALRGDELPKGLDYTIFDYGVNSGIARPGKVLRLVLGLPRSADWRITDEILEAINEKGVVWTIKEVNAERRRFLRSLRTCATFCKGWMRRVVSVRARSLRMAGAPAEAGPLQTEQDLRLFPSFGKAYRAIPETGDDIP